MCAVVVGVLAVSLGSSAPAQSASTPGKLGLVARAGRPVAPRGGSAVVLVGLANPANPGTATSAGPASFTVKAPAGFRFEGAADLARTLGLVTPGLSARLKCRAVADGATCSYTGRLPAGKTLGVLARFVVPASAVPGRTSVFTVTGAGSAAGTSARFSLRILSGRPKPELDLNLATGAVQVGGTGVERVSVVNVGSAAAVGARLTNLLPPLVATWSARGAGWTCTGSQGAAPSCAYARPVAPGAASAALTIRFTLDVGKVAGLKLQLGGKPAMKQWQVGLAAGAFSDTQAGELTVLAPPGSLLLTQLTAVRGRQELLPGAETTIDAVVSNQGLAATEGRFVIAGSVPPGTSLVRVGGAVPWTCRGGATPAATEQPFVCLPASAIALGSGRSLTVKLTLLAANDAKPGDETFGFAARAENEPKSAKPNAQNLPITILEGNTGIPALSLMRSAGGRLTSAADGGYEQVYSGRPFTERLDVRNAGGAAIAAGEHAQVTQKLTGGARIASIGSAPGWSCTGTTSLSCTVAFETALAPGASAHGPTIVVTAGAPTRGTNWEASIRSSRDAAPKARTLPVLVSITHGAAVLVPNFTNVHVPTAGGNGTFGLSVSNDGNVPTTLPAQLYVHLPHGVRFRTLEQAGWRCSVAAAGAHCTAQDATLLPGRHLPHLTLHLSFAKSTENKVVSLAARATQGGAAPKASRASIQVEPRHALVALIKEPDHVAFDDQPIVRANEKLTPTTLMLEGDGSGGSGVGLRYRWVQRCTTAADAAAPGSHCSGVTPKVAWKGSRTEPDAMFAAPQVQKPTWLVFDLTITDGSATSTDWARLKVLPLPSAKSGFAIRNAHPAKEKALGPRVEHRALPKPAETLTAGAATPTPKPKHDTAPPTTTTTGTATAATTTTSGPALPEIFCQLVRDAANSSGSFDASVGGVSFGFANVHVSGSGCTTDTTVSFSGAHFSVASLDAKDIGGSISATGITLTGGTVTGPAAWKSPTFTLSGGGLSVPFGSGPVSLSGTIEASGFAFVPLPSGWTGTTSVGFAAGGTGTSVSVTTTATGPRSDASPGSPAPVATISGNVASDGTFSLDVDVQRIVQLEGAAVNLTGSVKRETPGGAVTWSFEGELDAPVTLVPGLQIAQLNVKMAPTADSLGLTGNGLLELTTSSTKVGIHVRLAYDNPANWSLTAEGVGDTVWSPLPNLSIAAKDFSGAIVAKDDAYQLTLKAKIASWKPTDSVTISNLELSLSNTCPDTGAACPPKASVFLDLKAGVSFALPGLGSVDTSLAGSLALPSGEFSVEAKLAAPVSVGAGISIRQASVLIQRGMGTPSEEPTAEAADSGGYRVDLMGAVSVPGIGDLPTVHASFSPRGWAVAVPLGSFSLPGGSGDGSRLSNAVVGWASYATSFKVVDPVTKAITSIQLPANQFKLTGDFTTPAWMGKMLKTPDVNGRVTGIFDPENDFYKLRMDFSIPGQPYLYGSASSATSVRLNSTFFEITRSGASFDIALGGAAVLNARGSGDVADSTADLTVALSYSVGTQTVAGSLSLISNQGWMHAFGVRDLKLYGLAITLQVNIASGIPGLGIAGSAVLPPTFASQLGLLDGARATVVANISLDTPCIGISVDDPSNSGRNVLSLGKGTLTAKLFRLEIAPFGCKVGEFSYKPGVSLDFDGEIAGISVDVGAHLGLSPFSFDGSADIGEIPVGGLTIKKTHLEVALSASKLKVVFNGGVDVFGTNVDINGSLERTSSGLVSDFTGTLDQLNFGDAVKAQGLLVAIKSDTGKGRFSFSVAGKVSVLDSSGVNGKFDLVLQNGNLTQAVGDIDATVNIGGASGLTLGGKFHVDYSTTRPLTLTANVTARYGNTSLANASLALGPGYFTLTAGFAVPNVFSAQLVGNVYYGGVPKGAAIELPTGARVVPKTGDFYIAAKDVTLNLSGFTGRGTVYLLRNAGTTTAGIDGSVQIVGTSGTTSIGVKGNIDSNNNFSLTGTGKLDLAGIKTDVTATVAKSGSTVSVSGKGAVNVLGQSVTVGGDFKYAAGKFLFRLNGTTDLRFGGYSAASTNVKFSNFPEDAGISAAVNFRVGSTVTVNGNVNIGADGSFDLSAAAQFDLRITRVNGTVHFYGGRHETCISNPAYYLLKAWGFSTGSLQPTICATSNVAPTLYASATIGKDGFNFGASLYVDANGNFDATFRTPTSGNTVLQTGELCIVAVCGYAQLSYHLELRVTSSSPYLSLSGSGDAAIYEKHCCNWKLRWTGYDRLIGIGVSFDTNPWKVCGWYSFMGLDIGGCLRI
ncbi:MAG TPA: hypothetical protein VHC67_14930 [Gaiellaceae bacterium]|nr:hypothetical protein [Gaiellaceae bacterium]